MSSTLSATEFRRNVGLKELWETAAEFELRTSMRE
jgi:hypothetical protein